MSTDVADLVLVRLAHIEHEHIILRIETPLQLFDLNFRNSIRHRFLLPTNAAKLVVVYQLRDRGMRATHRAVGIFSQFQLAKLHAQSVNEQEPSNERLADSENQLDPLRRLPPAPQPGQDAEPAALRAGWDPAPAVA